MTELEKCQAKINGLLRGNNILKDKNENCQTEIKRLLTEGVNQQNQINNAAEIFDLNELFWDFVKIFRFEYKEFLENELANQKSLNRDFRDQTKIDRLVRQLNLIKNYIK